MVEIFKKLFYKFNIFILFFFSFGGYYVLLILVSNFGYNSTSRTFTIPIRILILLSLIYLLLYGKSFRIFNKTFVFFLFFSILYLFRILIESYNPNQIYMSKLDIFLYFISFVFIPFIIIFKKYFSEIEYKLIFNTITLGTIGVAILTYFYYGYLLGKVSRITDEISKDENFISPLALSYSSVLGISLILSYMISNKISFLKFLFFIISIVVLLIPFFLGASRGSILSISLPFLLFIIFSKGILLRLRVLILIFLLIIVIYSATDVGGIGVFNRFDNIFNDIETGNNSSIRLVFWKESLLQFLKDPFFGNSLQSEFAQFHPHNIFIEVLISTGIVGFIPFFIFLFLIFKDVVYIIRNNSKYFWVTNIFLIGFMQNMFTGAIWGASWLALGAALIVSYKKTSKINEK